MTRDAFHPFLIRVPTSRSDVADGLSLGHSAAREPAFGAEREAPITEAQPRADIRTYAEARRDALSAFERDYVEAVLACSGGNVSKAARIANIDRVYLHRLMRRHEMQRADAVASPSRDADEHAEALKDR